MEVDDAADRRYTIEELLDEEVLDIPAPPAAVGVGQDGEPRLMIKQIVNENFKSYAGRAVIGPFHKAFTSIVGPNGSGKSNVIDSMLFVFGYRAQKIRSKKVSVLIHNSENHPNLRQATVSVHFQMIRDTEDGDYEVIPNSEFVVSRTAFKDNSSHYAIDGRKTNFKEVGKLLREKGIDLVHNRFLILQGEVEQISQMKPKAENPNEEGMLEYLEDIIGSSRLKSFIEILNNQVEQLNEHRTERNNRVKLAEEEMNKLRTGFEEATKWIEVKNNLTRNQNQIYQANIFRKESEIEGDVAKVAELEEQIKKVEEEVKKHVEENKEIFKAAQKAKKKRTKIENTLNGLKDKAGELESKNQILHQEKKGKKDRKKKLEKELRSAEAKVEEFTQMPEKCAAEQEELDEKLQHLVADEKRQESSLQETIAAVEQDTAELRRRKEPLEKKLMSIEAGVNAKLQQVSEQKAALETYTSKHTAAKENLAKIQAEIESAEAKKSEVEAEKGVIEEQIPQLKRDIENKERHTTELQSQKQKTQEDLAKVQGKLSEAKQLGGDVRSKNRVFDYIMNHLKKKKIVDGIIGRLGDLGGIDKRRRFDVALSSSCNMDVMVVETSRQATEIIKHMKRENVGACTFYAMDKMTPFREPSRNLPGPRLVDQIRCDDPELMKCFYKSCGDTLYAGNISQARQMANCNGQRFRVVSLDGSLVERSGTLTGGGNRVMSGAMAESPQIKVNEETVSEAEIQEMQEQTDALRDEMRRLDGEIRKLLGEIAMMKKQLKKSEERFEVIGSEWSTADEKMQLLAKQVKPAEKEVKTTQPDKKELQRIEEELKDAEINHGAAKAEAETARDEVEALNKQIGEKGKGKIEGIKKQIKKTKSDIAATKKKILKSQNDAKTAERNRKKAESSVTNLQEESKEIEERMENIKIELEKALVEFQELETDREELEETAKEAKEAEKKTQEAVEKSEKDIEHLNVTLQQHQAAKHASKERMSEAKHFIKSNNQKLSALSIKQIDETDPTELEQLTPEQCADVDIAALATTNTKLQAELDHHRPNLGAIAEFKERQQVYKTRMDEYMVVNDARNKKREVRNDLLKQRHQEFIEGFEIITNKVKQMYQMITLGGDAELELVNSLAPFDDGVVFTVRPPKKSWKNIMNLSGGEKTLSSLALVFALHHYKPTPLYVMDEIDAALDIKNVSIVANYIKDRTKNAQFIIISLRNQMFGLASRLCGIYKTDNCTKMVLTENVADTGGDKEAANQGQTTVFTRSPMKTATNRSLVE